MVILKRLHLEPRAILALERVAFVLAVVGHAVLLQLGSVKIEERWVAERLLSIGPAQRVHLQKPEVQPELDLFLAVFADKFPHDHLAGLVIPVIQQMRNVEVHGKSMWTCPL